MQTSGLSLYRNAEEGVKVQACLLLFEVDGFILVLTSGKLLRSADLNLDVHSLALQQDLS